MAVIVIIIRLMQNFDLLNLYYCKHNIVALIDKLKKKKNQWPPKTDYYIFPYFLLSLGELIDIIFT